MLSKSDEKSGSRFLETATVVLKCHEIFYLYFLAQKTLYLAKMAQRTFQFGKDNSIFKFENHVSRGNGNLFLQQVIPHFYIFTLLLLGRRAPPVKISQPLPPLPRQPKFCILNESENKTPGLDGGLRGSKNIRKKKKIGNSPNFLYRLLV